MAPAPLAVEKRTPRSPSGLAGSTGRLGHPIAPTTTSPSTIKARQTAYWPPRRNPLVPSMGSRAQMPSQYQLRAQLHETRILTALGSSLGVTTVNEVHHLLSSLDSSDLSVKSSALLNSSLNEVPDQSSGGLILTKDIGILLTNNGVTGEGVKNGADNSGLCAKVTNW
jgi:hypothetical protein